MNNRPMRNNNTFKNNGKYLVGRQIRFPTVLCIDQDNTNHGVLSTDKALELASQNNLDLVLISYGAHNQPPTCRILDFGKFKYEQDKREKAARKKQRENCIKIKEAKLHPSTDIADLQTKARQMQEFIDEGNKLKVTVVFRGRELCHKEVGVETLAKFINMFNGVQLDGEPVLAGKNLIATIVKKQETAK